MDKNKIIIGLNDVSNQRTLASYGASLAKRLERSATLTSVAKMPLVSATQDSMLTSIPNIKYTNIEEEQRKLEVKLNELCLKSKMNWKDIDYEVEIGFLESSFIKKAKEEWPFLFIIEGNNELTTIAEWFGTYETRLAEQINVPTLVVPSNYPWKPVHDILYVMKMDDQKTKNLRTLINVAKELNSNLSVLIVSENNEPGSYKKYTQMVEVLKTFYDYEYLSYQYAPSNQTATEIINMTNKLKVGWLAFEHEESNFIDRIFSDLNSKKLILQSKIPVLVF